MLEFKIRCIEYSQYDSYDNNHEYPEVEEYECIFCKDLSRKYDETHNPADWVNSGIGFLLAGENDEQITWRDIFEVTDGDNTFLLCEDCVYPILHGAALAWKRPENQD